MGAPRDYSLTFAGAGTQEILSRGRYIRVLEADTAGVYIAPANGSELLRVTGQEVDAGPDGFGRIYVRSTVAQTARFVVSDTHQDDSAVSLNATVTATVEPGNANDNGGDVACGAAAATQLLAADATRKYALITNVSSNTITVRIGGAGVGAASGTPLEPGTTLPYASTAAIFAYNPGPGAVSISAAAVQKV